MKTLSKSKVYLCLFLLSTICTPVSVGTFLIELPPLTGMSQFSIVLYITEYIELPPLTVCRALY